MSEETQSVVRRYWGAANTHDGNAMRDVLADDYVPHDPGLPVPDADRETHIQIIAGAFFVAFPDLHVTIHDMVSYGDKVAIRWDFAGTQTGDFPGDPPLPATGKQVQVNALAIHRVAGDKLAETWVSFDLMGMMQQPGVGATPG